MKLPRLTILAAALAMAAASPALADTPVSNIVVVNVQQIMHDSDSAKSVREQLATKQKSFQAEISKREGELQKEDQDLHKEQSVLSKDAFEKKVNAFRSKMTDAQKDIQTKKAILDSASARGWDEIQKNVTSIISDMAKEKGFTVAIASATPTSEVLYADPKLDITSEVLSRLNQKLPKLDAKFDLPTAAAAPASAAPAGQ